MKPVARYIAALRAASSRAGTRSHCAPAPFAVRSANVAGSSISCCRDVRIRLAPITPPSAADGGCRWLDCDVAVERHSGTERR